MSDDQNGNGVERCPVCGAAVDTGARKNAAEGAVEFINEAKEQRRNQEFIYAASLYGCALELAFEAARPDLRAEAYWGRGTIYEELGDRDMAFLDYEDAHKIAPDNDVYLESLADMRAELDHEKRLEAKTRGEI